MKILKLFSFCNLWRTLFQYYTQLNLPLERENDELQMKYVRIMNGEPNELNGILKLDILVLTINQITIDYSWKIQLWEWTNTRWLLATVQPEPICSWRQSRDWHCSGHSIWFEKCQGEKFLQSKLWETVSFGPDAWKCFTGQENSEYKSFEILIGALSPPKGSLMFPTFLQGFRLYLYSHVTQQSCPTTSKLFTRSKNYFS